MRSYFKNRAHVCHLHKIERPLLQDSEEEEDDDDDIEVHGQSPLGEMEGKSKSWALGWAEWAFCGHSSVWIYTSNMDLNNKRLLSLSSAAANKKKKSWWLPEGTNWGKRKIRARENQVRCRCSYLVKLRPPAWIVARFFLRRRFKVVVLFLFFIRPQKCYAPHLILEQVVTSWRE